MTVASVCGVALLVGATFQDGWTPAIAEASGEGEAAIAGMQVPDGFEVQLFAAEPMVANPVCLWVDNDGECYVVETFRHGEGVADIRDHMEWVVDDLRSRTVDDRRELLKKWEGERYLDYGVATDRIRRLVDDDGDGVADFATVFAGGFDDPLDGLAAGLLIDGPWVYFACIPHLWVLTDNTGDGVADLRKPLSSGYGVNIGMLGHDLHGLRVGPDGRLYFSVGDRGFHVETERGSLAHAHTGAVLRCELDGSKLEVFHTGLRNPQELVFDEYGNLFTGDNNSDSGDRARFVQLVEGGDSGWRYAYQWIEDPVARGPWNAEKLWYPHFEGQAAYLLPPIANLASGPSGLTYSPGTGLPEAFARRFFLCDFSGARGSSGIHAFDLVARRAGFELGEVRPFVWGALATDCDFGPDGALWFTDWVEGWAKPGKGRVYRVFDPAAGARPAARAVRALLGGGIDASDEDELMELLDHPDQRVRQGAQFELVAREHKGVGPLTVAALRGRTLLTRLHAIWGVGMAGRRGLGAVQRLVPLLGDAEPEIRAQVALLMGEHAVTAAFDRLVALLADDAHPRVQMFAAFALGKLGDERAVAPLQELLRRVEERDPVLRHASIRGLVGCAPVERLADMRTDPSPFVRLGAVVALRAMGAVELERFLVDADARVVLEAARAIHDLPVPEALPSLAYLMSSGLRNDPVPERWMGGARASLFDLPTEVVPELTPERIAATAQLLASRVDGSEDELFLRRVMNANYRLGGEFHAWRLADFSAREAAPVALRAEAVRRLVEWATPPLVDAVVGEYRDLGTRPVPFLPAIAAWLLDRATGAPAEVVVEGIRLAATAEYAAAVPSLEHFVSDEGADTDVRLAALDALRTLDRDGLAATLRAALASDDGALRAAALDALGSLRPDAALALVPDVLARGEPDECRAAYAILARVEDGSAVELLVAELERLAAGEVPAELALDLVLAAEQSAAPEALAALEARRATRAADPDPDLAPFLDGLFGGNAARGERVFRRPDLSCLRCHDVAEADGSGVGPGLVGSGQRRTRHELLESIVSPNRELLPGYEATVLELANGDVIAGRIVAEDARELTVLDANGVAHAVDSEHVLERRRDLSAMPEKLHTGITRLEMRDLLEFLGTL